MEELKNKQTAVLICLALALGCLLAYSPVVTCEFINYDDKEYVSENPYVKQGLTGNDIAWAMTAFHSSNWHPLTWMSHMLDCELYGLKAGGHHLTNLLLHTANALLLFGLLRRLTGALWRSALVAALFAWHPLHVESVAWVAERKDVLSAFFWLLTMGAYVRYVEERGKGEEKHQTPDTNHQIGSKSQDPNPRGRAGLYYALALMFFALGLLSKPMVVTLPFVLLLLDYWPLARISNFKFQISNWPLVMEKMPFFLLAAGASVVTVLAQKSGGAVVSLETVSVVQRLENATVSYAQYLRKMVWPDDLAMLYPFNFTLPWWQVALSAVVLGVITLMVLAWRGVRPYLLFGWLWYLGTLVPVIGLVQVGRQSMADRYTYLPLIGIFVMVVWGADEWLRNRPRTFSRAVAGVTALLLACCLLLTWFQARTWRDTLSVFERALAVKAGGWVAHANIGTVLTERGRFDEAEAHFHTALELRPNEPQALFGLGLIQMRQGKAEPALEYFSAALRGKPDYAEARYNLGRVFAAQGKVDEAIAQYKQCLALRTDVPDVYYNLGNAQVSRGNLAEAAGNYRDALSLDPGLADAHNNLGAVLVRLGLPGKAVEQFAAALKLQPNYPEAEDQWGVALQKLGRLNEAREHYAAAVRLKPELIHAQLKLGLLLAQQGQFEEAKAHLNAVVCREATNDVAWYNLAALDEAYARAGRFENAIQTAQQTQELAIKLGQAGLAEQAARRLELYRAGKPYRE